MFPIQGDVLSFMIITLFSTKFSWSNSSSLWSVMESDPRTSEKEASQFCMLIMSTSWHPANVLAHTVANIAKSQRREIIVLFLTSNIIGNLG